MNRFIDHAIHPRCISHERRKRDYLIIAMECILIFLALALFWPSLWLLLLAPVIGIILVTHPGCLLTGFTRNHQHGGMWR